VSDVQAFAVKGTGDAAAPTRATCYSAGGGKLRWAIIVDPTSELANLITRHVRPAKRHSSKTRQRALQDHDDIGSRRISAGQDFYRIAKSVLHIWNISIDEAIVGSCKAIICIDVIPEILVRSALDLDVVCAYEVIEKRLNLRE
jgi:hypothetical protein